VQAKKLHAIATFHFLSEHCAWSDQRQHNQESGQQRIFDWRLSPWRQPRSWIRENSECVIVATAFFGTDRCGEEELHIFRTLCVFQEPTASSAQISRLPCCFVIGCHLIFQCTFAMEKVTLSIAEVWFAESRLYVTSLLTAADVTWRVHRSSTHPFRSKRLLHPC